MPLTSVDIVCWTLPRLTVVPLQHMVVQASSTQPTKLALCVFSRILRSFIFMAWMYASVVGSLPKEWWHPRSAI